MTQVHRLADLGRVDRRSPLSFTFNGKRYQGYAGDTLASALLANGVMLVGRSFKYHRPRGIVAAGPEEPNALVQLERGARTLPNQQATQVELYDGLVATSVNAWPSPAFDVMAVNSWMHRVLPAGFYYKTFMWPRSGWKVYERFIRGAAGLGVAPKDPDPDTYDHMNVHVDVLVVGGGPAGISAALAASRSGARVLICDQQPALGGSLLWESYGVDGMEGAEWAASAAKTLAEAPDAQVLPRTQAFGYYDHNYVALLERRGAAHGGDGNGVRERVWHVRAKQVVLATGAIERPLIFADNDRPGVMLASAVRQYVNRYGVVPGNRVAIFTNNDDAYRTALELYGAGVKVACVIDVRRIAKGELPARVLSAGIEVIEGAAVTAVKGKRHVRGIEVMALTDAGDAVTGTPREIECDVVGTSGGWNPAVHLSSHAGAKPVFEDRRGIFLPGPPTQPCASAGAAAGRFALQDALDDGHAAGLEAAAAAGFKTRKDDRVAPRAGGDLPEEDWRLLWTVPTTKPIGERGKHFLDQQNDVTAADIQLAAREGYRSVEHAKRYTTLGMATDQGKTGNVPGMATLAAALGQGLGETGTTTFRPPYTPVTLGALAGRHIGPLFDPVRRTPIHAWHEQAGCAWEDVGQWKRPWYYPRPGESMRDAVARECAAVRNHVGIMDASTLGKIDIQGPDARELLNRVYTNAWTKLEPGRCRYGLMLDENGMVMDDGVTACLADDHFHMTTTTGNAAKVLAWLEEWLQTEWPELRVYCTSVTEAWATISLAGPNARALLSEFTNDIDLSPEALPFMSWTEGTVGGVAARVFRISFTGESTFEVNVPASAGLSLWTELMNAGAKYGIAPFGTEAMHVLRAEKGFIIVGQETDKTVSPGDLGMDWIVSTKKDFIGKRSLIRADTARADRKQLVGLKPRNTEEIVPEGGQIVDTVSDQPPMTMVGHVTSSYWSSTLGRSFALALVRGGRGRHGETVYVPLTDRTVACEITSPVFYDPEGSRLHD